MNRKPSYLVQAKLYPGETFNNPVRIECCFNVPPGELCCQEQTVNDGDGNYERKMIFCQLAQETHDENKMGSGCVLFEPGKILESKNGYPKKCPACQQYCEIYGGK